MRLSVKGGHNVLASLRIVSEYNIEVNWMFPYSSLLSVQLCVMYSRATVICFIYFFAQRKLWHSFGLVTLRITEKLVTTCHLVSSLWKHNFSRGKISCGIVLTHSFMCSAYNEQIVFWVCGGIYVLLFSFCLPYLLLLCGVMGTHVMFCNIMGSGRWNAQRSTQFAWYLLTLL